eukprot:m.36055 g.36055  ORF g.36055 m.36055 type:complete len:614 (-) comp9633_c0_seq4:2034-3875(-)
MAHTDKPGLLRLLRAARQGDTDTLFALIGDSSFMVDMPSGALRLAMNAAAVKGQHVAVAGILAMSPWILNEQDELKQSPLHWAVFGGSYATVVLLLGTGASCMVEDSCGRLPIHIAAIRSFKRIYDTLLRHGSPVPGPVPPDPLGLVLENYWQDDATTPQCACCDITIFSFLNRRHHCRQCGDVICSSCSVNSLARPGWRVCRKCVVLSATELGIEPFEESLPTAARRVTGVTEESVSRRFEPRGPEADANATACREAISHLQQYSWFRLAMSRSEAEQHLRRRPVGDFVVRPSTKPTALALSSHMATGVSHMLLHASSGKWQLQNENGVTATFPSVEAIVLSMLPAAAPKAATAPTVCPDCRTSLAPQMRFCSACGASLLQLAVDASPDTASAATPAADAATVNPDAVDAGPVTAVDEIDPLSTAAAPAPSLEEGVVTHEPPASPSAPAQAAAPVNAGDGDSLFADSENATIPHDPPAAGPPVPAAAVSTPLASRSASRAASPLPTSAAGPASSTNPSAAARRASKVSSREHTASSAAIGSARSATGSHSHAVARARAAHARSVCDTSPCRTNCSSTARAASDRSAPSPASAPRRVQSQCDGVVAASTSSGK